MAATLCWLGIYYLFLRPLNFLPVAQNSAMLTRYEEAGLRSRFSYFQNWRQYEYMHIVCWLGKDWAWTVGFKVLWVLFSVPTLLLALDFVWVTGSIKVGEYLFIRYR